LIRRAARRPPPGTVQLAEPPRPAPAPSAVRAADAEEDDESEEEQDRAEDAEEEEQEENAAPLVPRPQNTRTIEIERFVPAGQVDLRYLEKPYYVVPRGAIGHEAFAVTSKRSSAIATGRRVRCASRPNLPGQIQVTVTLKQVSLGTELNIVQEGLPDAIPLEACYLGWQQSLRNLEKLVEPEINQ
jgi:hypothetical protein